MTILLVDDELATLRAIVDALKDDGHHVIAIDDAVIAKGEINAKPRKFHLAIIDKTIRPKPPLDDDEFPPVEEFERVQFAFGRQHPTTLDPGLGTDPSAPVTQLAGEHGH